MKYDNLEELKKLIVNGELTTPKKDRDIIADFDISLPGVNIDVGNINAGSINAEDVYAGNINAGDIYAGDINAGDIYAGDISALGINAGDISYYAFVIAYKAFTCKSITGRRINSFAKCLDGEIEYK